jgi:putative hydrolase of the HAD superfamily
LSNPAPLSSPASLQLVVFDFDGLIIDTESAILDAWRDAYSLCQRPFPESTFQEMIGRSDHSFDPWDDILTHGTPPLSKEKLVTRFGKIHHALIQRSPVLPGVIECLFEARARGIRTAVASSSSHTWVDRHLADRELTAHFDLVRCRDDVARAKPWPDLYLSVLGHFGLPPSHAIAFEDSFNGLTAARKAGLTTVAVPNAITRNHDLSAADRIVTSLEELDLDQWANRNATSPATGDSQAKRCPAVG